MIRRLLTGRLTMCSPCLRRNYIGLKLPPIAFDGTIDSLHKNELLKYAFENEPKQALSYIAKVYVHNSSTWGQRGNHGNIEVLKDWVNPKLVSTFEGTIDKLNGEELLLLLELVQNWGKKERFGRLIVERFLYLVNVELYGTNPGFEMQGSEIKVTMRQLESHTFARLAHRVLSLPQNITQPFDILAPAIKSFLTKESKNMSFEDYTLVLDSLLLVGPPSDIHNTFLHTRFTTEKITSGSGIIAALELSCNLVIKSEFGTMLRDTETFRSAMKRIETFVPYATNISDMNFLPRLARAADAMAKVGKEIPDSLWKYLDSQYEISKNRMSPYWRARYQASLLKANRKISNPTLERDELLEEVKRITRPDYWLEVFLALRQYEMKGFGPVPSTLKTKLLKMSTPTDPELKTVYSHLKEIYASTN